MEYATVSVRVGGRGFVALLIPYLTLSNWYYLFVLRIPNIMESLETMWPTGWAGGVFNLAIAFSVLIGAFFMDRVDKLHVIYMWAGVMPIAMVPFLFLLNMAYTLALLLISGLLFGLSILAYCVYFCSLTAREERGRVSGAIIFISLLSYSMLSFLISDFRVTLATCIFLCLTTFTITLFKPKRKPILAEGEALSTVQNGDKSFLLYLVPWLTYCAINGTLAGIVTTYLSTQFTGMMFQMKVVQYVAAGFSAVIAGVFADWVGRRAILIVGVLSYGVGTALTGLASSPQAGIFSIFMSGVSWGIFLSTYTLVVWGDLSSTRRCAPLYAAGISPFYFSRVLRHLILPLIPHPSAAEAALLSGLLVFLSLIPLIYASESLPEETRSRMDKDWYYYKAKKILKKFYDESQPPAEKTQELDKGDG